MPHERRPPDDPREWINRARSNLVRAQAMLPGVYLQVEDLCFDAQQAAEKAIKAVLIARGAVFPPTHDLAGLLTILGQNDEAIPPAIAVATRYPGATEPVTAEEHHRAVAIAEAVVTWADERVGEESSPTR